MLWAPALLLAFLAPASQTASNLEWSGRTVTKQTGELATITCDIELGNINYVHWYRLQEGEAPKHILHYSPSSTTFWIDSGIKRGKYRAFKGSGRSYKLEVRNLEESHSGVYSCATWERHGNSDFPYPTLKTACGCQEQPCATGNLLLSAHFLALTAFL